MSDDSIRRLGEEWVRLRQEHNRCWQELTAVQQRLIRKCGAPYREEVSVLLECGVLLVSQNDVRLAPKSAS